VDFVQSLYIDFDFDAAQHKLRACSEVRAVLLLLASDH